MKEAIEKAIDNDFDPDILPVKLNSMVCEYFCGNKIHDENNIYHLIFGTDFVDKLVGEGGELICNKPKGHFMCPEGRRGIVQADRCDGCEWNEGQRDAAYHLEQMSNPSISRDIDKFKDYIRTLI